MGGMLRAELLRVLVPANVRLFFSTKVLSGTLTRWHFRRQLRGSGKDRKPLIDARYSLFRPRTCAHVHQTAFA